MPMDRSNGEMARKGGISLGLASKQATLSAVDDTDIRRPTVAIGDAGARVHIARIRGKYPPHWRSTSLPSSSSALSFIAPGLLALGLASGAIRSIGTGRSSLRPLSASPSPHRRPVRSIRPLTPAGTAALSTSSDAVTLWCVDHEQCRLFHPMVVPSGCNNAIDCQYDCLRGLLVVLHANGDVAELSLRSLALRRTTRLPVDQAARSLALPVNARKETSAEYLIAAVLDAGGRTHILSSEAGPESSLEEARVFCRAIALPHSLEPGRDLFSLHDGDGDFGLIGAGGCCVRLNSFGGRPPETLLDPLGSNVSIGQCRRLCSCIAADVRVMQIARSNTETNATVRKEMMHKAQSRKQLKQENVPSPSHNTTAIQPKSSSLHHTCEIPASSSKRIKEVLLAYGYLPYRACLLLKMLNVNAKTRSLAEPYIGKNNAKSAARALDGLERWTKSETAAVECAWPLLQVIAPALGCQWAFLAAASFLIRVQSWFQNLPDAPRQEVSELAELVSLRSSSFTERLRRRPRYLAKLFRSLVIPLFVRHFPQQDEWQPLLDHVVLFGPLFASCAAAAVLLKNQRRVIAALGRSEDPVLMLEKHLSTSIGEVIKEAMYLMTRARESLDKHRFPSLERNGSETPLVRHDGALVEFPRPVRQLEEREELAAISSSL